MIRRKQWTPLQNVMPPLVKGAALIEYTQKLENNTKTYGGITAKGFFVLVKLDYCTAGSDRRFCLASITRALGTVSVLTVPPEV